jgi:hypothetical protein
MNNEASRPEHIDLVHLVAKHQARDASGARPRQAHSDATWPGHLDLAGRLRYARSARDGLTSDRNSEAAIRDAQAALRVLAEAIQDPAVQLLLDTMERGLDSRQMLDPDLQDLLASLLDQPAGQPMSAGLLVGSIRSDLEPIASQAQGVASESIPDDPEARAARSAFMQIMLDVLISMLTNIMVAAAFTVKAVEDAARRGAIEVGDVLAQTAHVVADAAQGAGEVAGQTLELAAPVLPVLPVLLTVTLIGVQAAHAVMLLDHARQSIESPRQPRPDTITPASAARQDARQPADAESAELQTLVASAPPTSVGRPRGSTVAGAADDTVGRAAQPEGDAGDFNPVAAVDPDVARSDIGPEVIDALVDRANQRGVAPDSPDTQREH